MKQIQHSVHPHTGESFRIENMKLLHYNQDFSRSMELYLTADAVQKKP